MTRKKNNPWLNKQNGGIGKRGKLSNTTKDRFDIQQNNKRQ